uniref:Uncharacterized protein n=1 Tax=Arundo donax TaxID=35708 RepID=A0A0A9GQ37_ARUDO
MVPSWNLCELVHWDFGLRMSKRHKVVESVEIYICCKEHEHWTT